MAQNGVCNSCGGALNEGSVFCSSCGVNVSVPNEIKCSSCGYGNTSDQQYCSSCGIYLTMSIRQTDEPKSVLSPVTTILRIFLVVISIVIFPVGIAIGAFYIVRKKNMTFGTVLLGIGLLVLILFVVFAQSDSSTSPEQELMKQAEGYYELLSSQNVSDTYRYLSPEVRKVCALENYTETMNLGLAMMKDAIGISQNETITFKPTKVIVKGSEGFVYGSSSWAGQKPESSSDVETWVYSDEQWWYQSTSLLDGCDLPN